MTPVRLPCRWWNFRSVPTAGLPRRNAIPASASVKSCWDFDHLLFVLALLLIVRGPWMLVKTITAFTVAHSITLGLAALGFINVPSRPVEAAIALCIMFLCVEIVHAWVVAFAFGLLHGLGFAGALADIGLPQGEIPAALLFFNVSVEIGQLIFVAAVLLLAWMLR